LLYRFVVDFVVQLVVQQNDNKSNKWSLSLSEFPVWNLGSAVFRLCRQAALVVSTATVQVLEIVTPTRCPFSGHGCHGLTWRSHGHSLFGCL